MVTNPLSCIRRTALLSSPFILSLYPSLSAQQIYNGDVSLFEQTIAIPTVPLYVGYGENQDTNLTLNTTWISAGNGSRFGDSNGTGSRNTVVVDIGFYSQMEFQSGGRTYIGYDGDVTINVDPATESSDWVAPNGALRTRSAGLAQLPGSSATINLIGPFARWNPLQYAVDIGVGGEATVNLIDGGYISNTHRIVVGGSGISSDTGGGTGTLNIDGQGSRLLMTRSDVYLGIGRLGTGIVNVTNSGLLDVAGDLYVGNQDGGDGTLIVNSGGTVNAASQFLVNSTRSNRGYVKIDGEGSTLNVSTTEISYVGNTGENPGSEGILEIVNGGKAFFPTSSLRFGQQGPAIGHGIVDGAGSELHAGVWLQMGYNGTGSLRITNGGLATAGSSSTLFSSVGRNETGNGHLLIDGTGSRAMFHNSFYVASGSSDLASAGTGTGLVEISNGGVLEVGNLFAVRGNGDIALNGGTVRMLGSGGFSVAGENASLTGEGLIEGNLEIGYGAEIAGSNSGIAVTGNLSGFGVVENFTLGGADVRASVGGLTFNNVRFDSTGEPVLNIHLDQSPMDNLVSFDGETDFAGVNLMIVFEPFAPGTDTVAHVFNYTGSGEANYNFASVTLPDGWLLTDGILHHESNPVDPGPGTDDGFVDWIADYGFSGNDAAPDADPDGDGFSNLAEFSFGTNPGEASSSLAEVKIEGGRIVLRWNRRIGEENRYQVQSTENLTGWGLAEGGELEVMTEPDTAVPEGYERVEWSLEISAGEDRGFYRVNAEWGENGL